MDNQTIMNYLEGNLAGKDLGRWTSALKVPELIVSVLRVTFPALRTMEAGRPVDDLFLRTQRLISDIALASPQQGEMVGEQIVAILRDNDPRMRALAAVHSALRGIPSDTVVGTLIDLLLNEPELLIRYAVAASLLGLSDLPHQTVVQSAMVGVSDFKGQVENRHPTLVHRVRNEYLRGQDQLPQDLLIVKLGVYYIVLQSVK